MTRVEIAPGVFREQTNVIPLTSTEAVDKAWDAYAAHVARSREDRDEQLAGFTAASLAGSYRVTLAEAERKLAAARKGRG